MDLIRYRRTKNKGDIWLKPAKHDMEVFKHCSGGRTAVPTSIFTKEVEPILHFHKIYSLSFKDET